MTAAQTPATRAKNPPPILTKAPPKGAEPRRRPGARSVVKKPDDLTAMRDALPFFKSRGRNRKGETSWWNVTPSGDYAADMETGKAYARAFLPMMVFNCGSAALAQIVSEMAITGRDPEKNSKDRGIDDIALGFLHEIGNSVQAAIGSIATATVALKGRKNSKLRSNFVETVESKGVMHMLRMNSRSTLFHDPGATIFSELLRPRAARR